jgi:hypothetical protein
MNGPTEEFVSEPITPVAGTSDISAMARGEPGVPQRFIWRDKTYVVQQTLETWKTSTRDRGELYLRRHWYRIVTTTDEQFVIYCQRQTTNRNKPQARWWIYSIKPRMNP